MTAVIIGVLIVALVSGAIGLAFDVSGWVGFLILIGIIGFALITVHIINKNANKIPRFVKFLSGPGLFVSIISVISGIILAVIGIFTDAGYEEHTYHQVKNIGGTWVGYDVSYMADAISSLLWLGIFIAVIGVVLFFSCALLKEPDEKEIQKLCFEKDKTKALKTVQLFYENKLITETQYTAKKQEIEERVFEA